MTRLYNVKMFVNAYKDFDYSIPYEATIVSRYKLNNKYEVPVIYAYTLNDSLLDNFRDSLCDMYAMLYVSKMENLPDAIGFIQYKRYFINVFDYPNQYTFTPNWHCKLDSQFKAFHSPNEWDIFEEFINKTKYRVGYKDALEKSDSRYHSMFILPKDNFLELAEIIEAFARFYMKKHDFKSDEDFKKVFGSPYTERVMGSHILERLISVYSNYLISIGIKINESPIVW